MNRKFLARSGRCEVAEFSRDERSSLVLIPPTREGKTPSFALSYPSLREAVGSRRAKLALRVAGRRPAGWGACSADSNVGRDCAESTPTPASAVARPTLPTLRGGGIKTRSAIGLYRHRNDVALMRRGDGFGKALYPSHPSRVAPRPARSLRHALRWPQLRNRSASGNARGVVAHGFSRKA